MSTLDVGSMITLSPQRACGTVWELPGPRRASCRVPGAGQAEQRETRPEAGDGGGIRPGAVFPGGAVEAELVLGDAAGVVAVGGALAVGDVAELAGDPFGCVVALDVLG
jgi:hypothetical protein